MSLDTEPSGKELRLKLLSKDNWHQLFPKHQNG
jgi:hypothetical protein